MEINLIDFDQFMAKQLPNLAKKGKHLTVFVSTYNTVTGYQNVEDLAPAKNLKIIVRAGGITMLGALTQSMEIATAASVGTGNETALGLRDEVAQVQTEVSSSVMRATSSKKRERTIAFVYAGLRGMPAAAELCKELRGQGTTKIFSVACSCVRDYEFEEFVKIGGSDQIIMGRCGGRKELGQIIDAIIALHK